MDFFLSLGDHYRFLFGKYAGWAQSVLFTSHLKKFETENLEIKRKKRSKSNKRSVETESNSMSSPQPSTAKKRKCK
ncbi:unnamed protein product [Porites evermanni]|uniref:Uncharacterized protein n=1 Tax=Porites evermanni TaxID=104178 RepID=A0ABN8SKV2_9CNID|nr:unnamed protein product [Porites evermanni]